MAIPSLTLRNVKGSALTFTEMDTNLQNLANAVVQVSAGGTTSNIALNSTITIANSATVTATQSAGTITLVSTAAGMSSLNVTAGGVLSANTGFTIANTATIGASISGNTISLTGLVDPTTWTSNIAGNGNYLQNVIFNNYREKTANTGPYTGTVTLDANLGPVQTGSVTGNITINTNNVTNLSAGESLTVILYATGNYTLTSNLKFVQGTKTISTTAGNVDALTIYYDGTSYLAGLAKYW